MNRLGLLLVIIIIPVFLITFWHKSDRSLSTLPTTQCICDVDTSWSSEYQKKMIEVIKTFYNKNRNPEEVIKKALDEFPEISDMKAEICGADTICFNVASLNPLFVLEDTKVITDNGMVFEKENFDQELVSGLPKITSKKSEDINLMINFVKFLPSEVFKNYEIDWKSRNFIIFQSKKDKGLICLVSDMLIPDEKLLKNCSTLYELSLSKQPKKKQKDYKVEYDIRFKNQIIVRSGGNYG